MHSILSLLLSIDRIRKRRPLEFHVAVTVLISPIAVWAYNRLITAILNAGVLPPHVAEHTGEYGVVIFEMFLALVTGIVVAAIINPVLPWVLYMPYAVAMRSMGLLRATTGSGTMSQLLPMYLKQHGTGPVRVICISGKHLFREAFNGDPPPLQEFARAGRLQVVMPASNANNPTITARFDSYSQEFQESHYPSVTDLVAEVDAGKHFLRTIQQNVVTEHHMLCMWRVILLSGHCLLQTYFPNVSGSDSDEAPVFVFENSTDCEHSYYRTFDTMFKLIVSNVTTTP